MVGCVREILVVDAFQSGCILSVALCLLEDYLSFIILTESRTYGCYS